MESHLILLVVLLLESCSCERIIERLRHLVYPDPKGSETKMQVLFGLGLPMEGEVSLTLGYVLKCNYKLPYISGNDTRAMSMLDTQTTTPEENEERREKRVSGDGNCVVSRWSLYRILEGVLGKSCLLRAVCEASAMPFFRQGLLGQLLHALLTPSMTSEEYEIYADRQYHAVEDRGRRSRDCQEFYRDCPRSPLDYFSRIIDF